MCRFGELGSQNQLVPTEQCPSDCLREPPNLIDSGYKRYYKAAILIQSGRLACIQLVFWGLDPDRLSVESERWVNVAGSGLAKSWHYWESKTIRTACAPVFSLLQRFSSGLSSSEISINPPHLRPSSIPSQVASQPSSDCDLFVLFSRVIQITLSVLCRRELEKSSLKGNRDHRYSSQIHPHFIISPGLTFLLNILHDYDPPHRRNLTSSRLILPAEYQLSQPARLRKTRSSWTSW